MSLIHAIFNEQNFYFNSNDAIETFYVKTGEELSANENFYIFLKIGDNIVSFTNKFQKVNIEGIELYEINFFAKKMTIPMNLVSDYKYVKISIIGSNYPFSNDGFITIKYFNDIYYLKGDPIISENESNHSESIIIYNDSELAKIIRSKYNSDSKIHKIYEDFLGFPIDNIFRTMHGLCTVYLSGTTNIIPF